MADRKESKATNARVARVRLAANRESCIKFGLALDVVICRDTNQTLKVIDPSTMGYRKRIYLTFTARYSNLARNSAKTEGAKSGQIPTVQDRFPFVQATTVIANHTS